MKHKCYFLSLLYLLSNLITTSFAFPPTQEELEKIKSHCTYEDRTSCMRVIPRPIKADDSPYGFLPRKIIIKYPQRTSGLFGRHNSIETRDRLEINECKENKVVYWIGWQDRIDYTRAICLFKFVDQGQNKVCAFHYHQNCKGINCKDINKDLKRDERLRPYRIGCIDEPMKPGPWPLCENRMPKPQKIDKEKEEERFSITIVDGHTKNLAENKDRIRNEETNERIKAIKDESWIKGLRELEDATFRFKLPLNILQLQFQYECSVVDEIEKESTQGHVIPVYNSISDNFVFLDRKGALHFIKERSKKTLQLSTDKKDMSKMTSTEIYVADMTYPYQQAIAIDNELYVTGVDYVLHYNQSEQDIISKVEYKKEFNALIKGIPIMFDEKLAVLTVNNELNILNINNGDTIWNYNHKGNNEIKEGYFASPAVFKDETSPNVLKKDEILIIPFANGELVAFDQNRRQRWSYQLATEELEPTYIINSPQIHDEMVVVISNHDIVALQAKTGKFLWSQPMRIKNSNTLSIRNNEGKSITANIVITENNEVIAINTRNGHVIWEAMLPIASAANIYYAAPENSANYLFIVTNKGVMFLLNESSGKLEKIAKIPQEVYHPVKFLHMANEYDSFFTTEKQGVYYCSDYETPH